MAIRSKFRKLKCQWHVSFIDYSTLSSFSYYFYYSTLINARVAIYSRILKEFHVVFSITVRDSYIAVVY